MQSVHEQFVTAIRNESHRLISRRGLLGTSAKLAGGSALAMSALALPRMAAAQDDATPEASPETAPFADDIEVLNYALTLEHLEYAFYRDGLETYGADLGTDAFGNSILTYFETIRDHEQEHVDTLTSVIEDLDGEPVEEAEYDFGLTDANSFIMTAAVLENTGVSAYDGAGQYLENAALLTAAGTIVAVEARHASYLNLITGVLPFPSSVETPLTPDEVLDAAGGFIVS